MELEEARMDCPRHLQRSTALPTLFQPSEMTPASGLPNNEAHVLFSTEKSVAMCEARPRNQRT